MCIHVVRTFTASSSRQTRTIHISILLLLTFFAFKFGEAAWIGKLNGVGDTSVDLQYSKYKESYYYY